MKSRKPIDTKPCTPITRAIISSGRCRENCATANVHQDNISTHSSIEPSCEPQLAATLYCRGNCELEFVATLSTEKSLLTNDQTRHRYARVTKNACPRAAGRATAIQTRSPRAAPAMGRAVCTTVISSARISAK